MQVRWPALLLSMVLASGRAQSLQAQGIDSAYALFTRHILTGTLSGAGHRVDEIYIAADSSTAAMLRASGMSNVSVGHLPVHIDCPGAGLTAPDVSPVGYAVSAADSSGADPS